MQSVLKNAKTDDLRDEEASEDREMDLEVMIIICFVVMM